MKPYKAEPLLKERLWGGQKLKEYNKCFEGVVGESWETDKDTMPVLIKLIDANDVLSVQVHPDDAMAWELERQQKGKTEAWIVLDCDDGAELIAGLRKGTTKMELEKAMSAGSIEELLNIIPVKKGDCIYIPAGTVHCLGKGMLIYEVQQPSDITYRLYDWDRTDDKGKSRELHISKALKSVDYEISKADVFNLYDMDIKPNTELLLFQNQYFTTSYMCIESQMKYELKAACFSALTVISGTAHIAAGEGDELAYMGDTWILPAGSSLGIEAVDKIEIIVSYESFTSSLTLNN